MLLHPDRVEPQLLGPGDLLEGLPVVVATFDGNEPDLESCHGLRPHRGVAPDAAPAWGNMLPHSEGVKPGPPLTPGGSGDARPVSIPIGRPDWTRLVGLSGHRQTGRRRSDESA